VEDPAAAHDGGLPARAADLAGRYEALATAADAAAVRWRWATPTSGHGDVEPLRLERMGCAPGRWLHRPPPPWQEHEAIGFDAFGRDGRGVVWRSGGQPHPARRDARPSVPARLRRQVCV